MDLGIMAALDFHVSEDIVRRRVPRMTVRESRRREVYPFAALVDQELLKTALILNAINPRIGGLLIRGEKGSGKSTAVRALADLLPDIEVSKECGFNCDPDAPSKMCDVCRGKLEAGEELETEVRRMRVVDLPLGATEDRVVGSLDLEKALNEGVKALQPGILAEANQNILYIDEVNLLPDHIVDDILDAAASGWNVVEREGISVSHPSRFILVGSMNPEEGELRPQLLDRLPLSVSVEGVKDEELRVQIIKRNIEFARNPEALRERFDGEQEEIRGGVVRAVEELDDVEVPDKTLWGAARLCMGLNIDGHRPDIVMIEAAKTLAAFHRRSVVSPKDLLDAAVLSLQHRTRSGGFEEPATPQDIQKTLETVMEVRSGFFRGSS